MTSLVLQMFHRWMSLWNMSMKVTSRGSDYKTAHIFSMHLHKQRYHLETNENNSLHCDITAETHTVVKNLPKDSKSVLDCCQGCKCSQGRIGDSTTAVCSALKRAIATGSVFCTPRYDGCKGEKTLWTILSGGDVLHEPHLSVFLMLRYACKITSSGKYNIPFEWHEYETTKALVDIFF